MRKFFVLLFLSTSWIQVINSQTVPGQGKPIAEIFTDFHYNINDTTKTTGFGINRAYLGYNFIPAGDFTAQIVLNVGSPDDLPAGSVHHRYSFFREASLAWNKDKFNITFGLISTRMWEYQQRFWGKRYVAATYQALNGYGYVADMGVSIEYKFSDIVKADFFLMNGEGYSELQLDNNLKSSASMLITPDSHLAFRFYSDLSKPKGVWQNTLVGFAGYKNDLFTIGAELSYKSNLDITAGHDAWGISGTGTVSVYKQTEVFVRYDYSTSVTVPGDPMQWNYRKDGNFVIGGIQYTFSQNVKVALDYQGTNPYNPDKQNSDAVYLNATFKF
jgi:hypothetical protein